MEHNGLYTRKHYSDRCTSRIGRVFGWAFIGLIFVSLFALVFGFVVKWLWNMLMPNVFGVGAITFWQAVALVILAKLLFGGFGHPHRSNRKSWHDWSGRHYWHRPWNRFGEKRESTRDRFGDWKYYHRFWEDEGKEAFKAYVKRKSKADTEARNEKPEESEPDKNDN